MLTAGVSSTTVADASADNCALFAVVHCAVCTVTELAVEVPLVPPPLPVLPETPVSGNEGGLETVTYAVPAAPTSAAGIDTVMLVDDAIVTVGGINENIDWPSVQFKVENCVLPVEPEGWAIKPVPVTVRFTALPTVAQEGETAVTTGVGLGGLFTIKAMVFDKPLFPAPEAGLIVLTVASPGVV